MTRQKANRKRKLAKWPGINSYHVAVAKRRWDVGTGRVLLVAAEAVAAMALACQFLLPIEWMASIGFRHRDFALRARWLVSLLLLTIAGGVSLMALFSMFWRLAHFTLPAAGQ